MDAINNVEKVEQINDLLIIHRNLQVKYIISKSLANKALPMTIWIDQAETVTTIALSIQTEKLFIVVSFSEL